MKRWCRRGDGLPPPQRSASGRPRGSGALLQLLTVRKLWLRWRGSSRALPPGMQSCSGRWRRSRPSATLSWRHGRPPASA